MLITAVAAGPSLLPSAACNALGAVTGVVAGPVVGIGAAAVCPKAISTTTGATSAVTAVVDFASNPLGYILQQERDSAVSMAKAIFPALENLTTPDLTQQWWLDTYARTFAVAILVWVLLLMWNFLLLARHRISGATVVDSLAVYSPLFFIGSAFGPPAAAFLMASIHSIDASIIGWALTPGGTSPAPIGAASCAQAVAGNIGNGGNLTAGQFNAMLCAVDPQTMTGGVVVGIIILLLMIIALLMVLAVLIVMMVTMYLTGVVLPLGLVWVINPTRRGRGLKIVSTWAGLLIAHPLLFFMLGVAFRAEAGVGQTQLSAGLKVLVNVLVAFIAIVLAVTSPTVLLRFAPVSPTGDLDLDGPRLPVPAGLAEGLTARAAAAGSQAAEQSSPDGGSSPGGGSNGSGAGRFGGAGPDAGGGGGRSGSGSGSSPSSRTAVASSANGTPGGSSSVASPVNDAGGGVGPEGAGSSVQGGGLAARSSTGRGAAPAAARGGTPATASEAGAGAGAGAVALPVLVAARAADTALQAAQRGGGMAAGFADLHRHSSDDLGGSDEG